MDHLSSFERSGFAGGTRLQMTHELMQIGRGGDGDAASDNDEKVTKRG